MSTQVEKIKERLSITDVIGTYIKIDKAGANFKARCPFHHEKTPSFFISTARNTYYCFGCGMKGDIFSFVQEFEGLDFMGSLKVLAERAGVELVKENKEARTERERLYLCLESATIFFQKNLYTKEKNKGVVEYLMNRGLTKETIKEWRIGFAEDAWRDLLEYLKEKKFSEKDMEKVGLIKRKDGLETVSRTLGSNDFYDRFRSRIIFPIFDSSGRVIGFSGRIFGGETDTAKYLNSPETELFNKSQVLYGLHRAKQAIREKGYAIFVEGQMDIIMSHQNGFANTVAVSGTALTTDHLEIIRRLTEKVVMAFDPDSAGVNAALRSAKIALSLAMEVRVAELPKGEDPALFILNHKDEWQKIVDGAKHIVEFLLNHLMKSGHEERELLREIRAKVLPFLGELPSSMEQSHFVNLISGRTGIAQQAIWDDLKLVVRTGGTPQTVEKRDELQKAKALTRVNHVEKKLASIVYWQDSLPEPVIKSNEIYERLSKVVGSDQTKTILAQFENKKEELILEAELWYQNSPKLQLEIDELITYVREDFLKNSLIIIHKELSQAEKGKDAEKTKALLMEYKRLSDEIAALPKFK